MRTIKQVLENQEAFRREMRKLLLDGNAEEALDIISELGYQIRTENQAPLDEKEEYDNEVHELAIFLESVIKDAEKRADITDSSVVKVINAVKNAVRENTNQAMKTAEIRKNLSEYDIENYTKKLEEGIKEANDELIKTQAEYDKMKSIKVEIFGEESILLDDEMSLEEKYTQIRNNLSNVIEKYSAFTPFSNLRKEDILAMDPSTEEGRKQIESAYRPFMKVFSDLERRRTNAENNIETFSIEIETIDKEKIILGKDTTDVKSYRKGLKEDEDIKAIIDEKKSLAHKDNEDKFYGNPEKERLYREKFEKFRKHIVDAELTYRDKDGNIKKAMGKTVESYPGMEEDLEFLQLESYRDRKERVSLYESTKDLYAYNPILAKKLETASNDAERAAIKHEIEEQFKLDSEYIKTYHGAQNRTKMQYESYMNAGSALKDMVPVKSAKGLIGKTKAIVHNIGKFTGLKIPKFTRIDEDGRIVSDIKSGLFALAGDAVIIGCAAFYPLPTVVAYGAKGVGVLTMRGLGRRFKRKHKDDMDIPTPYKQNSSARRTAREKVYMDKGSSRIGARIRSTFDFIRPKHRKEIEDQIIEQRNKEIDKSIENQYILGAMASDKQQQRIAGENEITRKRAHEQVRRSGEVYNDIYREPEMAEERRKGVVDRRIVEATSLGVEGEDVSDPERISFTDSRDPRSTNFAKAKISIKGKILRALEDKTVYGDRIGETVWTSSITNEQVAEGITRRTDLKRRVVTVLAGLGMRLAGKAINDNITREYTVEEGTGQYKKVKVGEHTEGGELIGYRTKTITKPADFDELTVGDLQRQGDASWAAFNNGSPYYGSEYHPNVPFWGSDNTIRGVAFKFKDPTTGKIIDYSISSEDIGHIVHNDPNLYEYTQVYANGDLGISKATKLSDLGNFITDSNIRQSYSDYLSQFSGGQKTSKFLEAIEFSWGGPTDIPRGWAKTVANARKVVETTIDYNDPIYAPLRKVSDYDLVEILHTVTKTEEIVDPTLHTIKDALEKAGIATSIQQIGEAMVEAANPSKERRTDGTPHVKLDTAEDLEKSRKGTRKSDRGELEH